MLHIGLSLFDNCYLNTNLGDLFDSNTLGVNKIPWVCLDLDLGSLRESTVFRFRKVIVVVKIKAKTLHGRNRSSFAIL